ncbi:threonine synthase [Acidiplasma aeolicum]|uniref:Threonine synthase n=1 Tax=Acidiplasma aeolicum TaxID=507754 RepID=A0A0Q0WH61_9ARCH|nr:threonine synthase [Acidiplasma aeolicum]KQB34846.1 threonine synthase [Acidiplasma aeolicum]
MPYSILKCPVCGSEYQIERNSYVCDRCGNILDVIQKDIANFKKTSMKGVWRYKEIVHPVLNNNQIITKMEGDTNIYHHPKLSEYSGIKNIYMKHEGENPTGSFKDRGMTVAVSEAIRQGFKKTLCASTGNTSASAASYSAYAGIDSYVFIPSKKISKNKLLQAYSYGANIVNIDGDFDTAMSNLRETLKKRSDFYVLNSLNPWRIEGQKTIIYEIMEKMRPDFISFPAGNLGNTSAFGKALIEMREMGMIDYVPRLIAVQAEGASPFYNYINNHEETLHPVRAETVASAIKIGNPVNYIKAKRSIEFSHGIVERVSDAEILEAKKIIDRAGIGCESASATSLAGVKKLREKGVLDASDTVVGILTGNLLKELNTDVQINMLTIDQVMS